MLEQQNEQVFAEAFHALVHQRVHLVVGTDGQQKGPSGETPQHVVVSLNPTLSKAFQVTCRLTGGGYLGGGDRREPGIQVR